MLRKSTTTTTTATTTNDDDGDDPTATTVLLLLLLRSCWWGQVLTKFMRKLTVYDTSTCWVYFNASEINKFPVRLAELPQVITLWSEVVILRYVMLCHAMSYHVTLYYVMLCFAMLCYVMPCHVTLCYVVLCFAKLCYVIPCHVTLRYVELCFAMLCHAMSCYITLRWANSHQTNDIPAYLSVFHICNDPVSLFSVEKKTVIQSDKRSWWRPGASRNGGVGE